MTRRRLNLVTLSLVVGLAAAYLAFGAGQLLKGTQLAHANTIPSGVGYGTYSVSSDTIYTWDFDSASASSSNVDWAVRFIFKSNGEIDYVKDRLDGVASDPSISPQLDANGGTKHGYVDDGPEKQWYDSNYDADSGIKEGLSCNTGWDWGHMRLYARSTSDRNYNIVWGYYVIGTNHQDYESGDCDEEYRSYETQEEAWEDRFDVLVSSHSWSYASDYQYLGNSYCNGGCGIGYYVDIGGGNNDFSSDGYGTSVWVQ